MSARIMQILASLARRNALRTLRTICETQHQISTRKLEQYLEPIGDELAGYAFHLRMDYDAISAERDQLLTELAALRPTHPAPDAEAVRPLGYMNKKDIARLQDEITWDGTYLTVGVDHWAQWQEDTPYDHLQAIYTHPATVPAGSRVVPVELLQRVVDYYWEGDGDLKCIAQGCRALLEVKP